MGDGLISFEKKKFNQLFTGMELIPNDADVLQHYFQWHVCDVDDSGGVQAENGFDGVLWPLSRAMPPINDAYTAFHSAFKKRWADTTGCVEQSGNTLQWADDAVAAAFGKHRGTASAAGDGDDSDGSSFFTFDSVDEALVRPPNPTDPGYDDWHPLEQPGGPGTPVTRPGLHDSEFKTVDDLYDQAASAVNKMIKFVNDHLLSHLGIEPIGSPYPIEEDLERLIILPLSGDYRAIRFQAIACRNFKPGVDTFGKNIGEVIGKSWVAKALWEGQASAAFTAHLAAYGLVYEAVAGVVKLGAHAFDLAANASERIAIKVEALFVKLLKALGRLLSKATKLGGFCGLGTVAVVSEEVISLVKEHRSQVYEDVKLVVNVITKAESLKTTIETWANGAAEAIGVLEKISDYAHQIPKAVQAAKTGDIGSLPGVDVDKLKDITDDIYGKSGIKIDPNGIVKQVNDALGA